MDNLTKLPQQHEAYPHQLHRVLMSLPPREQIDCSLACNPLPGQFGQYSESKISGQIPSAPNEILFESPHNARSIALLPNFHLVKMEHSFSERGILQNAEVFSMGEIFSYCKPVPSRIELNNLGGLNTIDGVLHSETLCSLGANSGSSRSRNPYLLRTTPAFSSSYVLGAPNAIASFARFVLLGSLRATLAFLESPLLGYLRSVASFVSTRTRGWHDNASVPSYVFSLVPFRFPSGDKLNRKENHFNLNLRSI